MKAVAVFGCILSFLALVTGRIEPDFTHRRMVDRSGDGGSSGSSSTSSSSPGKTRRMCYHNGDGSDVLLLIIGTAFGLQTH